MQDEWCGLKVVEFCLDGIEVLCTFRQDQHLATLCNGITHLCCNRSGSGRIARKMPKDILDAGIGRHINPSIA